VIQDIEGATPEPTRRWHVAAVSATVAAISLALLLAIIVPPSPEAATSQAASSAPGPSASFTLMMSSNPMRNVYVDLTRVSQCRDGSWLTPPYIGFDADSLRAFALQYEVSTRSAPVGVVDDPRSGQPAVWSPAGTSRSVPVTFIYDRQGRYIVACAISDGLPPPEFARD
jgi:hypothetical protein